MPKRFQFQAGIAPLTPWPGALTLNPAGAPHPDSRYRLAFLFLASGSGIPPVYVPTAATYLDEQELTINAVKWAVRIHEHLSYLFMRNK